ncbi:MAG: sulfatase [Bryobacteraceae bacterium]|nr:sulfatase [Bryobacteraceae bacterium]
MLRRSFLASWLAAEARPNFVVMLIDDYGWSDSGCYGSKYYETPNLDALAREGVRFTNGYAACPVCSPTRASIMTGKYPARLGLTDWIPGRKQWPTAKVLTPAFAQALPLPEVTLAELLAPLGYVSASVGKWHLGGKGNLPTEQGFALNYGGTDKGSPGSYFPPYKMAGVEASRPDEYLDENLTERAIRFIDESRGKPFFLYLPHYSVHLPFGGKPELIEKYRRKAGPQGDPRYAAMVETMDASVGRLRAALAERGLARNTVFIFLGDNGGLRYEGKSPNAVTSNAPLRAGKGHLYEGGIRMPFVVHWPGVTKPGLVCDEPVSSVDILPTVARAVKAPPPAGVDGMDLSPALRGGKLKREAIYWHYPHYSNQGGAPGAAVRQGDWKLIHFYEDDRVELYNLREDLGERRNLARRNAAKARELRVKLDDWRTRVSAVAPRQNPAYDPATASQGLTGAEPPTPPVE